MGCFANKLGSLVTSTRAFLNPPVLRLAHGLGSAGSRAAEGLRPLPAYREQGGKGCLWGKLILWAGLHARGVGF